MVDRQTNQTLFAWLLFPLFFAIQFSSSATELIVNRVEGKDLPSQYITHIEQLSSGHLLFTTQGGPRIFDGKHFISLKGSGSVKSSPSDSYVYHAIQDNDDNIWLATDKGLFLFDTKLNRYEKIQKSPSDNSELINNNVRYILQDSKNNYWFATLNGISYYDHDSRHFKNYQYVSNPEEKDNLLGRIFVMLEHNNKIWIGSSKGLFTIAQDSQTIERRPGIEGTSYITSGFIDNDSEIWFGSDGNGIFIVNSKTYQTTQLKSDSSSEIELKTNNIWELFKSPEDRLWIGYWTSGITVYDRNTKRNYSVSSRPNDLSTLPSASIESITQDHSGLIWIATNGGAVSFNPSNFLVDSHHHIVGDDNSLPSEGVISAIQSKKDMLWIGSTKGLHLWNIKDDKIQHFTESFTNKSTGLQIAVWKILQLDETRLLLATERGIKLFDIQSSELLSLDGFIDINGEALDNAFYSVAKHIDGNIYAVSSASTVHRIHPTTLKVDLVFDARQSPLTAETEYYVASLLDLSNNLWLASTTGLHKFNLESGEVNVFRSEDEENYLSSNIVNDILISKNELWVATANGGINVINLSTLDTTTIDTIVGLPSNKVVNLFQLREGEVWFTTQSHVGQIDIKSKLPVVNPAVTSLGVTFYEGGASFVNENRIVLMGNRIVALDPDDLAFKDTFYPISLSRVSKLHKDDLSFNPFTISELTINPQDTLVSIEFSSLDFAYHELIRYRYKLEGHDPKWIESGLQTMATYTYLPPGRYNLVVESSNRDGSWNGNTATLSINVIAPWWQSRIAYTTYFVLIIFFVALYFRNQKITQTKERKILQTIKTSEARMRDVLWGSGDELWRWNLASNQVYTTANFDLEESPVERIQSIDEVTNLFHPDDKNNLIEQMSRHLAGETSYFEAQYRVMDSETQKWKWVLSRGRIVERLGDQKPAEVAGTTKDIDELKRTEKKLRYLANYDQLTNLPNRSLFLEHLDHSLKLAKRYNEKLAMLFLDLDSFKMINDTLGHSVGDQLLQSVAQRLQHVIRGTDNLARLSGDEFAIIIERISEAIDVEPTVDRIIKALSQPYELVNQSVTTSVSVGIAVYPEHGTTPSQLLKHADIAMYQAKRSGKKHYRFFHSDMNALLEKRIDMEHELKTAIEQRQFEAYYQARANVQTNHVEGFETLVRWIHPDKGMISPAEFIPVAEETGQILEIGEIVLDKACLQAAKWCQQGWEGVVSVNISALQFQQSDLVTTVRETLERSSLPPQHLELEITEGTLIKNIERTRSVLLNLKELGVKIALDDFGTGYSSLSYLQQLPIDVLKIDRSFIIEILHSNKAAQLSKAIINMAHSLGLSVVAEGIEEEKQLEFLKQAGCEEYQGYLFGRPVPPDELIF